MYATKHEAVAVGLREIRAKAAKDQGLQPGDFHGWNGNFRDIATEAELRKMFPP